MRSKFINWIIFIFPLILCIWGISYGLPMNLVGDEQSLIGGAIKMIESRQLIPVLGSGFDFLYYPPLISYLMIIAMLPAILWALIISGFDPGSTADWLVLNISTLWISSRLLSALFTAATVWLVYKISLSLYKSQSGAIASALLTASSFYVLVLGHFARHWSFTLFFSYLVILLAILAVRNRLKRLWIFGLICGAAIGTSLVPVFAVLAGFTILISNKDRIAFFWRALIQNIIATALVAGLLIAANARYIGGVLADEDIGLISKMSSFEVLSNFFSALAVQETIAAVLGVILLITFWHRPKHKALLLLCVLAYLIFIRFGFHFESRYVVLVVPAIIILGIESVRFLLVKYNKFIFPAIVVLMAIYNLAIAIKYNTLLTASDTREQAILFIEGNVKQESFIISSPQMYLPRTKESLALAADIGRINATERYILENYDRLHSDLGSVYDYQNLHFWNHTAISQDQLDIYFKNTQPSYFILQYWQEDEISDLAKYFIARGELIHSYSQAKNKDVDFNNNFFVSPTELFGLDNFGPQIMIYRLQ